MQEEILKEVMEKTDASYIKLTNDSHLHHHHKMSPGNNNSHFKLQVCSARFAGMPLVKRHRLIYDICDPFIKGGVHALAIEAYTEEEKQSGK